MILRMSDFGGERTLLLLRGYGNFSAMTEYQCWFCGQGIERVDAGAVLINIESLWRWADAERAEDDPWQSVYAHSQCAKDRLMGATMSLEPHIFGDEG